MIFLLNKREKNTGKRQLPARTLSRPRKHPLFKKLIFYVNDKHKKLKRLPYPKIF